MWYFSCNLKTQLITVDDSVCSVHDLVSELHVITPGVLVTQLTQELPADI